MSQKSHEDFSDAVWKCFPFDTVHYQWNIKDFGPLYIPALGATLVLDILNYLLYKNPIEYETDQMLSIRLSLPSLKVREKLYK